MSITSYRQFETTRTAVNIGAWSAIVIPAGSIDATVTLEDTGATFRVTSNNADALGTGAPVPAAGSYTFPGVTGADITLYITPSAGTFAVLQVQR